MLKEYQKREQFGLLLMDIVKQNNIAAAVYFKNYIKNEWMTDSISPSDRLLIKQASIFCYSSPLKTFLHKEIIGIHHCKNQFNLFHTLNIC